jgi:SNF2 family DNA or RNA helicase
VAQPQEDEAVRALYAPLLGRLRAGLPVRQELSALADDAVKVWSRPGFETFLSQAGLRFEPFDYQVQAARVALRRMRGRAILADEVGLGKTIEAGLVLAELRLRGLADRTLVITPAGLVTQWQEELERKFAVPTVTASAAAFEAAATAADDRGRPVIIASLAAARRDPLKSQLSAGQWDLLIVDEAHRVRSPRSASGKLVRELRARHLLLLTATPVENRLQDLYEMISLVSPGLLGTAAQFRAAHGTGIGSTTGAGQPPSLAPKNAAALRKRTAEVMIRHRRSQVSVLLPQRLAETRLIDPPPAERDWYADLGDRIRKEGRDATPARRLSLRSIARLAGSSPQAAAPALRKAGWDDLAVRAEALADWPKAHALLDQLRRHAGNGEKVLVFTAFRHTLDELAGRLSEAGIPAAVYHGSLPRAEKERVIAAFRGEVDVLLSTESAGEGRNLQFCHVMVNMDLPWNPMAIEQRLGRLHRVGQEHDVLLTNLVARGTIEEQVLRVLEAKINLFELVVGELDMILGRVDDDFDFESTVFEAFVASGDDADFAERMAVIGDDIARARTGYLASREAVDDLVGEAGD